MPASRCSAALVCLTAVIVTASGCGASAAAGGGVRTPVQRTSVAAPASTAKSTTVQSRAPRCHANPLKATAGSESDGSRWAASVTVLLRDAGGRACRLTTKPRLGLTQLDGRVIPVKLRVARGFVIRAEQLRAHQKSMAAIYFTWQNWCGARMTGFRIRVHLGRGLGTLRVGPQGPPSGTFVPHCGRGPSLLTLRNAFARNG
jgi:hypothetical protein